MTGYSFKDDAGVEWVVIFSLAVAEALQDKGVDVLPPTKEFFDDMFRGGSLTIKLLWECVREQAAAMDPPVTRSEFLKRIGGTEFTQAKNAVWSACSDFIQHDPTSYYLLVEAWKEMKGQMDKGSDDLKGFLDEPETQTREDSYQEALQN